MRRGEQALYLTGQHSRAGPDVKVADERAGLGVTRVREMGMYLPTPTFRTEGSVPQLGRRVELFQIAGFLESCPQRLESRRAGWLTNSVNSQVQIQDFELVHLNISKPHL